MGSIVTTISVDVEGAGAVQALAGAANEAADALDRLAEVAGRGLDFSAAGAGADKLAAQYQAAFAKIQAQADKLAESLAKIGDAGGDSADAGAAGLGKIDDALKETQEQADAVTASIGKADDSLKSLGDTGGTAAAGLGKAADAGKSLGETLDGAGAGAEKLGAGLKGLGDGGDQMAAQVAAWRAEMVSLNAETDKMLAKQDVLSARGAVSGASAASLNEKVAASGYLGTSSIEDDAAGAKASRLRSEAAADSAAAAQAEQKSHEMLMLGGAAALGYGIYEAAGLQQAGTRDYTSAGESLKNVPMIEQGILGMAGPTATSLSQLEQGSYWAESAGFHGTSALNVLRASAQGAYAEQAPLQDVTDAATSIMNAYGMRNPSQQQANSVVNQMLTAVGQGKMTMAGLSGSVSTVLPFASAAGISLQQVLGSIASMTSVGTSPQEATQELRHTIQSLQKPSGVQSAEMQMLGLNPVELSKNLGKEGLTGTIGEVDDAIRSHLNKSGMVMIDTMNQSKLAAQSAKEEIAAMPPAIRGVAQAYADGKVSAAQWNAELYKGSESAQDRNLLEQFATTENTAKGFSSLVKSGLGDKQTVAGALSAIMGGMTGAQTAEILGGSNLGRTSADVDKVADSAKHAGANIQGWAEVQKNLNYQLKDFEYSLQATSASVGQVALPLATGALHALAGVAGFFASNPELTKTLAIGGGILGAGMLLPKAESAGVTALQGVGKIGQILQVPGAEKLAGIGQGGGIAGSSAASAGLDGVASAADGAAAALSRVAGAGDKAALGEDAAGTAGDRAALGETAAGTGGEMGLLGMLGLGKKGKGGVLAEEAEGAEIGEGGAAAAGATALETGSLMSVLGPAILGVIGVEIAKSLLSAVPAGKNKNQWDNPFGADPTAKDPRKQGVSTWAGLGDILDAPVLAVIHGVAGDSSKGIPAGQQGPHAPNSAAAGSQAYKQYDPAAANLSALDSAKARVQADINAINTELSSAKAQGIKIPAPDMSALESAKGTLKADLNALNTEIAQTAHPAKVPSPDLSALASAKGTAAQEAAGLTSGAQQAMRPVKAPSPDLSALAAAKGAAASDGAAVDAGMAAGINANVGLIVAAAEHAGNAAAAALAASIQSHSPSQVTKRIGADFDTGFGDGITAGSGGVVTAAGDIGSDTVSSLVQGLLGGQDNIQNATTAILGQMANPDAVSTIQQTIQTLQSDVSGDTGLVKWLGQQENKLDVLANKQGQLTTEITDAQQLATSAIGGASITSAYGYTPALAASNGPIAAQSIVTGMQQQMADTKAFAQSLAALQKQGLNATSLSQLSQAGTATGLPLAEGLQQGGKGMISQLNAYESQIIKSSQQIGTVGGQAMYQAGIAVTDGLATSLKAQLAKLDTEMTKEANAVIKAVQGHTGTGSSSSSSSAASAGSPAASSSLAALTSGASGGSSGKISAALSGLDRVGPAGGAAAAGLDRAGSAASAAASGLARLSALLSPSQAQHGGGHAGGTTVNYTVNVTVNSPTLGTMKDVANAVSEQLLKKSGQNWQNALPARPAY